MYHSPAGYTITKTMELSYTTSSLDDYFSRLVKRTGAHELFLVRDAAATSSRPIQKDSPKLKKKTRPSFHSLAELGSPPSLPSRKLSLDNLRAANKSFSSSRRSTTKSKELKDFFAEVAPGLSKQPKLPSSSDFSSSRRNKDCLATLASLNKNRAPRQNKAPLEEFLVEVEGLLEIIKQTP
jgi:hypothetical protein